MDYQPVEENEYNTCRTCGEEFVVTETKKHYCSLDCGFRDKLAEEYHCPVCNQVTYSMEHDPYCSDSHRKRDVEEYDFHKSCRVCGAMFHGGRFDWVCSDYCENNDDYIPG